MKHTTRSGHGAPHGPRHTGRRRKSYAFAAVAVAGLVVSAMLVAWTASRRETDAYLTKETNTSFDLQELSPTAEASLVAAARPAPAAAPQPVPSSLVKPIPLENMAGSSAPRPQGPRPPAFTPKAERWARAHKVLAAFLKAPARYLTKRSAYLASPKALKAFLADPRRVNAYLDSSLVRAALNSPAVTKAVLSDPGVAKAFLGSPAMQDAGAVKALLTSKLFKKVLDCPGPQAALEDPSTITRLVSNPATLRWLGENPNALAALTKAAPALASAAAPQVRRRR